MNIAISSKKGLSVLDYLAKGVQVYDVLVRFCDYSDGLLRPQN